jgi:hypothetical protein
LLLPLWGSWQYTFRRFDADALDEILGLRAKGLRSCVMLPVGYRDTENDWLVNLTKVRKKQRRFSYFNWLVTKLYKSGLDTLKPLFLFYLISYNCPTRRNSSAWKTYT